MKPKKWWTDNLGKRRGIGWYFLATSNVTKQKMCNDVLDTQSQFLHNAITIPESTCRVANIYHCDVATQRRGQNHVVSINPMPYLPK